MEIAGSAHDDKPAAALNPGPLLAGFWMGGFEGADHVNAHGVALDLVRASGHLEHLGADHARAAAAGLSCIRESIGWRLAEPSPGVYDLERVRQVARSAHRHGLQVLWTLMHYGLPDDLNLHHDALIPRLADFAREAARVVASESPPPGRPPVFTPINEIGFLSWAASMSGLLAPPNGLSDADDATRQRVGYEVKRRLVRASLAAMAALREQIPNARFLHAEPLVHVVAPLQRADREGTAAEVCGWQWQALDMITGLAEPELGGGDTWLDLLGANHYHNSQWEIDTNAVLDWHARDARRVPLARLLNTAWRRYRKPLLVAETGHVGVGRGRWLDEMAAQVRQALRQGVPVRGVCLYPMVDRPDWNDAHRWHRSGLWHVDTDSAGARTADPACLRSLDTWRTMPADLHEPDRPVLLVFSDTRHDAAFPRAWQLLSPLAGRWRVVFVEPPHTTTGAARLDVVCRGPRLDVLVPHLPACGGGGLRMLHTVVSAWWYEQGLEPVAAWMTAEPREPMPLWRADAQVPWPNERVALGCDVHRHGAGPVGGWDSHEAERILAAIAMPRIIFVGDVDDRLDLTLIAALAAARPLRQFIFVGAVVPALESALPRCPSLHWLGWLDPRLWPEVMVQCQAGIQPFRPEVPTSRRDERALSRHEYHAARLPVVSCARDVEGWLTACDLALQAAATQRWSLRRAALAYGEIRDWSTLAESQHADLQRSIGAASRACA